MANLFLFLLLSSFICLIVGLIRPAAFKRVLGKGTTRKKVGLVFGIAMIALFVLLGITAEPIEREEELLLQETAPKTLTPSQEGLENEILTEDSLPAEEEATEEDFKPEEEIQGSSIQEEIEDDPITQEPALQPSQETITEEPKDEESKIEESSIGGKWYTSSHHTARYYYHESCQGWQRLSSTYLKVFNNETELLSRYNRTLHPDCKPK